MIGTKNIFVVILTAAVLCRPATAATVQRAAPVPTAPAQCDDAAYRRANPTKCKYKKQSGSGALKIAGGAFAIAGGALAMMAMGGGADDGDNIYASVNGMPAKPRTGGYPVPSLGMGRADVLGDVDEEILKEIMSRPEYIKNKAQYDDIGLAFSLGRGLTGAGVTVAVLDTGDRYWHGRVVADIISAAIAPGATVEMHQVATNSTNFFSWDTIGGIVTDAARSASVINNSWNISTSAASITSREQIAAMTSDVFIDSIEAAARAGTIFVWAAGNDASGQSGALSALPGVVPELRGRFINVVAWDSETGELADFSNACGITKEWCLTAPGADIHSGYYTADGTSFAAPMVTAAIAVLQEAFPYLTPEQITELLFVTATDLGEPGVDEIYGHGMMDLERATQPVGASRIASAGGGVTALRTAHVNGTIARNIQKADINFAYFDAFGRPYQARLADNVAVRNRSIGLMRLKEQNRRGMQIGNMSFFIDGDDFLAGDGFLQTDGKSKTGFIEMNNSATLLGFDMFHQVRFGFAGPRPAPESVISEFSNIYTAAVAVGARHGDWTLRLAAPDTVVGGNMRLRMATGRADDGTLLFTDHDISLRGVPAVEYSLGYKGVTMGLVDNPYGRDEIYLIGRYKFNF